MKELTGQRFGLLCVLGKGEPLGYRATWRVHCVCGKERIVREDHLVAGRTKSCGCASSRFRKSRMEKKHNLNGKKFGSLMVVWRMGSEKVGKSSHAVWACKCEHGRIINVRGGELTSGKIKNCNCATVLKLEAHA
jgi:hypothetical protein